MHPFVGSRSRATGIALLTLLAGAGLVVTGSVSADAPPECFGKPATITGSGVIDGTAGHDVIVGSASDDTIDGKGGNDLDLRACRKRPASSAGWATTRSMAALAMTWSSATSSPRAETSWAAAMIGSSAAMGRTA